MKTALFSPAFATGLLLACSCALAAAPAPASSTTASAAQQTVTPVVQVQNAWVRATVPGQKVAAAYMQLQALHGDTALIALHSPAAPVVQLHGMQMQGDVMRMFEIKRLDLPQGQSVALQAGGTHAMLMDLREALKAGSHIQLDLRFANGQSQSLNIPVLAQEPQSTAQPAATPAPHMHHH